MHSKRDWIWCFRWSLRVSLSAEVLLAANKWPQSEHISVSSCTQNVIVFAEMLTGSRRAFCVYISREFRKYRLTQTIVLKLKTARFEFRFYCRIRKLLVTNDCFCYAQYLWLTHTESLRVSLSAELFRVYNQIIGNRSEGLYYWQQEPKDLKKTKHNKRIIKGKNACSSLKMKIMLARPSVRDLRLRGEGVGWSSTSHTTVVLSKARAYERTMNNSFCELRAKTWRFITYISLP